MLDNTFFAQQIRGPRESLANEEPSCFDTAISALDFCLYGARAGFNLFQLWLQADLRSESTPTDNNAHQPSL